MEKFNGNIDKSKMEKFKINLRTFLDDEEYRDLVSKACFSKMLEDMDEALGFSLEDPNPVRILPKKEESQYEKMYFLGLLDGVFIGMDEAKLKLTNKKVSELHKTNLKSNVLFSETLLKIIKLCKKDSAIFMNGDTLGRFIDQIEGYKNINKENLQMFSELVEQNQ